MAFLTVRIKKVVNCFHQSQRLPESTWWVLVRLHLVSGSSMTVGHCRIGTRQKEARVTGCMRLFKRLCFVIEDFKPSGQWGGF